MLVVQVYDLFCNGNKITAHVVGGRQKSGRNTLAADIPFWWMSPIGGSAAG